jgi:ERCC4-related helicase
MPDFSNVTALTEYYGFPFPFRADQVYRTEVCAGYRRSALFDDAGTGKTAVSTAVALAHDAPVIIVLAPPILGRQWTRWLKTLKNTHQVVHYRGTPKVRHEALEGLAGQPCWLVMTIQLFKKDFGRLLAAFGRMTSTLIVDEASCVAGHTSDNFKKVNDWTGDKNFLILVTATPANHPMQAYAFIELKTPGMYRNVTHFENCHVTERDFFDKPTNWGNLDLIRYRLMLQAVRTFKEDVLDLHKPNIIPLTYELSPAHAKDYKALRDTNLIKTEEESFDMTGGSKLHNAQQKLVTTPGVYGLKHTPAVHELIEEVCSEISVERSENGKLIIFSYYKDTSRAVTDYCNNLLKKLGKDLYAVACYSEVSASKQLDNVDAFMEDPNCRIMVAQPTSAGYGWNPQAVCWDVLFVETPTNPMHFRQAMERIWRDGQKHVPNVRIAVAENTVQEDLLERLQDSDAMASYLVNNRLILSKEIGAELA